jgi:hypothetical protein
VLDFSVHAAVVKTLRSSFRERCGSLTLFGRVSVIFLVCIVLCSSVEQYAHAGLRWDSIKTGTSKVISAPGKVARWGVGMTAGQLVAGVFDPTTERAAQQFKEAGNALVDHAAIRATELATTVNGMIADRITQADKMAQDRLEQTDQILQNRIEQFDDLTMRALQIQAATISASLERVDDILTKNVSRLERLSGDTLDRVESANLNISRYISTAQAAEEIKLEEIHRSLVAADKKIRAATQKHNGFLAELGLLPLPGGESPTNRE